MSVDVKVSLVMPSYQRGPKIATALESVLRQTRMPDEIIVVNDGGFPATTEWVTTHYPQVRLLNVEHGGAALARNRGAEAGSGEILVLFDDDDEMLPHGVATLLELLGEFPEARAAHCDATYTNHITGEHYDNHHLQVKAFERLRAVKPLKQSPRARLYDRCLYYALLWGNLLQQPWAIYRSTYLQLGGFCSGLGANDDWDLYVRVTRSFKVAQSDEVIAHHYVEKGKPHLTLAAGQEAAQMKTIRRQLALCPWSDVRAWFILRRRLGMFHKSAGDSARASSLSTAWRHYLRALWTWPFDYVVVARSLFWPCRMLLGMK